MYPENFEQACTCTGENPNDEKFTIGTPDEIAFKKLKVETDAINREDNEGNPWVPDWNEYNERKWQPIWDLEKEEGSASGFRFSSSYYGLAVTFTPVGLCFKTDNGLRHSVKNFLGDWKAFITGN